MTGPYNDYLLLSRLPWTLHSFQNTDKSFTPVYKLIEKSSHQKVLLKLLPTLVEK